jgi:hypothetical protein
MGAFLVGAYSIGTFLVGAFLSSPPCGDKKGTAGDIIHIL